MISVENTQTTVKNCRNQVQVNLSGLSPTKKMDEYCASSSRNIWWEGPSRFNESHSWSCRWSKSWKSQSTILLTLMVAVAIYQFENLWHEHRWTDTCHILSHINLLLPPWIELTSTARSMWRCWTLPNASWESTCVTWWGPRCVGRTPSLPRHYHFST